MGSEEFTEADVRFWLQEAIADAGSQKALATKLGVSFAYVSDMVRGNRPVQGKVLAHLGFERVSVIRALPQPDPERFAAAEIERLRSLKTREGGDRGE